MNVPLICWTLCGTVMIFWWVMSLLKAGVSCLDRPPTCYYNISTQHVQGVPMMKRAYLFPILLVLLASAAAYGLIPKAVQGGEGINVTISYSGCKPVPITVNSGSTFTISMVSNPTTGYSWDLAEKLDSKVLAESEPGKFLAPPQSGEPMAGAPGRQVWSYKAVGPGKAILTYNYFRPWEKGVAPIRTQKFEVTAK